VLCKDLVIDGLERVEQDLQRTLTGLTAEQLAFRPTDHANSIAWLAWHLTRVQDDHVSEIAGQPQAWVADGWHQRFGRPADPSDTGFGDSPAEVGSIAPEDPSVLIEYHAAVHAKCLAYLERVSCDEMDRIVDTNWDPPVSAGVRLVSVVNDCTQHVGQMAYIRGLIEGPKWQPY
jgi:hypothetical protein